jgi:hypothetical protein
MALLSLSPFTLLSFSAMALPSSIQSGGKNYKNYNADRIGSIKKSNLPYLWTDTIGQYKNRSSKPNYRSVDLKKNLNFKRTNTLVRYKNRTLDRPIVPAESEGKSISQDR